MTGFIAGILLSYINPINPYFVQNTHLWGLTFVYAFATFIVTVAMTQIVNKICVILYKRSSFNLAQVLFIVFLYNLVLIFGGRGLSFVLQDGVYEQEKMDYVFWAWHFYIYLISSGCYLTFLIYAHYMELKQMPPKTATILEEKPMVSIESPPTAVSPSTSVSIAPEPVVEPPIEAPILRAASTVVFKELTIEVENLYFVRAFQKYVDICHEKNGKIQIEVLRTTLLSVEEAFAPYPFIHRCHKSYLVNMNKIKRITGNARRYEIHLQALDEVIPVSRSHNEMVLTWFQAHKEMI